MGRWYNIFMLLSIENSNCNKVTLSMSVLASLGGGNFHNLSAYRKLMIQNFFVTVKIVAYLKTLMVCLVGWNE